VSPCTTDVHLIETNAMPNIVGKAMGHEAVGIVEEIGPEVKDFKVGDRVAISSVHPKWRSLEAQNGMAKIADNCHYYETDPHSERGGVFAEYVHIKDADMTLAHIPDEVTDEQAVILTDMATTAFAGVEAANVKFGDTVVIYGIGPVGLMAINAAIIQGAARVFAVGHRKACFDVAKIYGATDLIDYHDGNVADLVLAKTDGKPVDAVIISGGHSTSVGIGMKMVKFGGVVSNVSCFFGDETTVIPSDVWNYVSLDKTVKGVKAWGGRNAMDRLLALTRYGRLKPELVITHRLHGFEKVEEALEIMGSKTHDMIKPIVFFD